jgi:hypothetical protein
VPALGIASAVPVRDAVSLSCVKQPDPLAKSPNGPGMARLANYLLAFRTERSEQERRRNYL